MRRRNRTVLWGIGAGAVAAIVASIFAWLGVVNGDEGWYVNAARLVGEGKLPYRDFAYTQGPVYVYVLAPFVRVLPVLYTARGVSVVCTAVAIGLLVALARRVGGTRAAIAASVALVAAIPALPYWLSITKTYALTCLFLAAILFTLMSRIRPDIRYPLAAALAVGFAETRTSGVALTIILVAVLIARSPDSKTRTRTAIATALTLLPFVLLVVLDWPRAKWGLFDYHQLGGSDVSGLGRFPTRTFVAALVWPGPFVLAAGAAAVAIFDPEMRARMKRRPELTAVAVGIFLFVLVHEAGGAFFSEEYLAPIIAPIIVVSTLLLVLAAMEKSAASRKKFSIAVRSVLIVGIGVTAVTGGHNYYLGAPGWKGNPAGMRTIANCVQRNSKPSDKVFALSLEDVVVEARRKPVGNLTLGPFSYQDVKTKKAKALKIFNADTLGNMFNHHKPKVLVVTVDDVFETKRAGWFSKKKVSNIAVYLAFQKYERACTVKLVRHVFKNSTVTATVYVLPKKYEQPAR